MTVAWALGRATYMDLHDDLGPRGALTQGDIGVRSVEPSAVRLIVLSDQITTDHARATAAGLTSR